MYIYSRSAVAAPGKAPAAMAFAVEAAARITKITGIPVSVYRANFGAPLGSILWSTRYDSHQQMADAQAKWTADAAMTAFAATAVGLFQPTLTDGLTEIVSTSMAAPSAVVSATQATIANGKIAEAMELGVAIQAAIAKATGLGAAFCADVYGNYGGVRWLVGAASMAEVDAGRTAMNADPTFQSLVAKAGDCYLAGSGQIGLITKVN